MTDFDEKTTKFVEERATIDVKWDDSNEKVTVSDGKLTDLNGKKRLALMKKR